MESSLNDDDAINTSVITGVGTYESAVAELVQEETYMHTQRHKRGKIAFSDQDKKSSEEHEKN